VNGRYQIVQGLAINEFSAIAWAHGNASSPRSGGVRELL
jgi:hypothetical protein